MSKKDVQKCDVASEGALIVFANHNWESFGQFAYECFVFCGRRAIVISEKDGLRGDIDPQDLEFVAGGQSNAEVTTHMKAYDPYNEVIR